MSLPPQAPVDFNMPLPTVPFTRPDNTITSPWLFAILGLWARTGGSPAIPTYLLQAEINALAVEQAMSDVSIGPGVNPFLASQSMGELPWGAFLPLVGGRVNGSVTIVTPADTAQQDAIAALNDVWFVPHGVTITLIVGTDVATIDAALTAIAQWLIPFDSLVTIVLPTGAMARSTPVLVDLVCGARVSIVGAAPVITTATTAAAVTGASGAWSVPLTVASAAGIAADDYVLIRNVTGTGVYPLFSGVCKVTSVVGTTVTVLNTAKNAAWPASTLTAADLTVLKTVITFTGCDGFKIDGPLGGLNNVALVGNKAAGTIGVISQRAGEGFKNKGYVFCGTAVGISSFGDGGIYAQYGGTIDAPYLCIADCNVYNFLAQHGGSIDANNAISLGGQTGFAGSSGGDISAQNSIAVGASLYGFFAFEAGSILVQPCVAWGNVSDGVRVAWGGSIRGDSISTRYNGGNGIFSVGADIVASSVTATNNTDAGIYAEGGGSIYASSATLSNNGSYGAYADGACIDAPQSVAASNGINGYTATNNGTILANQLSGASNGTYLASASRGGYIRATNASAAGVTINADSGGAIDLTGASGAPTLSIGESGRIISTADQQGSMLLTNTSNFALGATNTARLNLDTASSNVLRIARSGALKTIFGVDDGGTYVVGAAAGDAVIRAEQALWFAAGGANPRGFIDASGNAALGRPSLPTATTDGFFYMPSGAGVPTGVPTAKTGYVPFYVDSSGSKVYAYMGGSWVALN